MRLYKLISYILFFSFIWISCDSDDISPVVEIKSPLEGTKFTTADKFNFEALITDNKELDFVAIALTGPNDEIELRKIELEGDSQLITEEFKLDFTTEGSLSLSLDVMDACENSTQIERTYELQKFNPGVIDLNIKLEYNGEPLVMFEPYEYPDGKKIEFTRCSFYTSEMQLDEITINEIEFHNLTNAHANLSLAQTGYTYTITNIPIGNYNTISFNIGVPEDLNNRDPGEFPSGHPLAKPAENWFSWMSFIFLKVEGNVDLNDDDEPETGVALHTGSNVALRNLSIDYPIQVQEGITTNVDLVFDIYELFNGSTRIYPIEENPQIHNLSQLDAVTEISDNLINAIHK